MILVPVQNIDDTDPIWLLAKEQSHKSDHKFKIGAVIARRGRVVSFAYNGRKSHPVYGSKAPYLTMHSEGACLYGAAKAFKSVIGADMYIYRRNGRTSRPCKDCERMLKAAGIARVFYSETTV